MITPRAVGGESERRQSCRRQFVDAVGGQRRWGSGGGDLALGSRSSANSRGSSFGRRRNGEWPASNPALAARRRRTASGRRPACPANGLRSRPDLRLGHDATVVALDALRADAVAELGTGPRFDVRFNSNPGIVGPPDPLAVGADRQDAFEAVDPRRGRLETSHRFAQIVALPTQRRWVAYIRSRRAWTSRLPAALATTVLTVRISPWKRAAGSMGASAMATNRSPSEKASQARWGRWSNPQNSADATITTSYEPIRSIASCGTWIRAVTVSRFRTTPEKTAVAYGRRQASLRLRRGTPDAISAISATMSTRTGFIPIRATSAATMAIAGMVCTWTASRTSRRWRPDSADP